MKNGLDILLDTYWSKGWKDGYISKEDFETAKKQGYMFDYPKSISHEETLKKAKEIVEIINPNDIANAFLYSLSTRKLEYRSALGSYYYIKAIPEHEIIPMYNNPNDCSICYWSKWSENPNDYELNHGINVYNFERYKFGGVRHSQLNYALFDLQQFLKLPKVKPTEEDKKILINILKCISKLNEKDKAGKLSKEIRKEKIFKTNEGELKILLGLLGMTDIISSKEFPGYEKRFANCYQRDPVEHINDYAYPLNRWHAKDGINYEKFEKIFGFKLK